MILLEIHCNFARECLLVLNVSRSLIRFLQYDYIIFEGKKEFRLAADPALWGRGAEWLEYKGLQIFFKKL